MKISQVPAAELSTIEPVAKKAFSVTPDASLDEWLSFAEMKSSIEQERGLCLKAEDDQGNIVGMMYAQQESPINGQEGREKWVIIIAAIDPDATGKGVGSALLQEMENQARQRGVVKMFTFTNKGDEEVIHFYQKNGYEDAGWIRDYQYGKQNSAVFLLKYLE